MIELTINDMTCGGCVASITRVVKGLDPSATVDADVASKRVRIDSTINSKITPRWRPREWWAFVCRRDLVNIKSPL